LIAAAAAVAIANVQFYFFCDRGNAASTFTYAF
jgi:hypothetical protein